MSDYEPKCKKTLPIIFDDRMPVNNLTPKLVGRVNNNTEDLKNLYEETETMQGDIDSLQEDVDDKLNVPETAGTAGQVLTSDGEGGAVWTSVADASGTSENLTAGNAEQLLTDKGMTDKVPYLLRASGGSGADREEDKIVGGTVAWNQLCNTSSVTVTSGHKYYMIKNGTGSIGSSDGTEITELTSGSDIVVDLSQMFGTAIADRAYAMEQSTAGSGINWLKSMGFFRESYYPYDAGTLKSVEGLTAHSMVGFNQWDEEWEVGNIDANTGNNSPSIFFIRAKNFIPVIPAASYYFKTPVQSYIYKYSKGGTYLGYLGPYTNATFTIPSDVYFVRFVIGSAYGTTYNHDICINLSWDGSRDGEYEPYQKWTYPLDSNLTLRGIPKLDSNNQLYYDGDEYASDGTVKRRYGIVDMGTLNWLSFGDDSGRVYSTGLATTIKNTGASIAPNIVSDKYTTRTASALATDATLIGIGLNGTTVIVRTGGNNPTGYAIYELATPTTEEADSYQNPQILDPYGTEEYETTGIVPVGHETFYPENLRSKIEGLPFNFATLIAPTESTYKATRAYSTGNLFIVDNILYKATASISNGGTITPGTNCTATTLAEVIAAL